MSKTQLLINDLFNVYGERYALNDRAHQWDHVLDVCTRALKINKALGLGLEERMIVVPALLHDLFNEDRAQHHVLAHDFILNDEECSILARYSAEERHEMALAALEHRSSKMPEVFSSVLAELIATSDRGLPNLERSIQRAILYTEHNNPDMTPPEVLIEVHAHMRDKFGRNGYVTYPELFKRYFKGELDDYYNAIDGL